MSRKSPFPPNPYDLWNVPWNHQHHTEVIEWLTGTVDGLLLAKRVQPIGAALLAFENLPAEAPAVNFGCNLDYSFGTTKLPNEIQPATAVAMALNRSVLQLTHGAKFITTAHDARFAIQHEERCQPICGANLVVGDMETTDVDPTDYAKVAFTVHGSLINLGADSLPHAYTFDGRREEATTPLLHNVELLFKGDEQ